MSFVHGLNADKVLNLLPCGILYLARLSVVGRPCSTYCFKTQALCPPPNAPSIIEVPKSMRSMCGSKHENNKNILFTFLRYTWIIFWFFGHENGFRGPGTTHKMGLGRGNNWHTIMLALKNYYAAYKVAWGGHPHIHAHHLASLEALILSRRPLHYVDILACPALKHSPAYIGVSPHGWQEYLILFILHLAHTHLLPVPVGLCMLYMSRLVVANLVCIMDELSVKANAMACKNSKWDNGVVESPAQQCKC